MLSCCALVVRLPLHFGHIPSPSSSLRCVRSADAVIVTFYRQFFPLNTKGLISVGKSLHTPLVSRTVSHRSPSFASVSSEFAGQVLRVDDGDGVFLDVVLLSRVLNPIFDHKLRHRRLHTAELIRWRDELLLTGVLREAFAGYLWSGVFRDHAVQSPVGELKKALLDVLIKLGVAFPLGRATGPAVDSCFSPTPHEGVGTRDMLVQRWAPLRLADHEEEELNNLLESRLQWGAREVMLKWMFDWAGPPQGLVGRLIASCHVIGEAEKGLCWTSGAVLKSHAMLQGADRLYVVEVRYTSEDRVLSIKMSGPLEDDRVWIALRFMASVLVNVSKEWQGMLCKGWIDCPNHARDHVYLATPTEVRQA